MTFLAIVLYWNYFFGGEIPSLLQNSYKECEEIVRNFLSSFRLVPHNVNGIPDTSLATMWQEFEENVSLNEDAYTLQPVDNHIILSPLKIPVQDFTHDSFGLEQ